MVPKSHYDANCTSFFFWEKKNEASLNYFIWPFHAKDFEISLNDLKYRAKGKQAKKEYKGWWLQHTPEIQAAAAAYISVSHFFKMLSSGCALQQQVGKFFPETLLELESHTGQKLAHIAKKTH